MRRAFAPRLLTACLRDCRGATNCARGLRAPFRARRVAPQPIVTGGITDRGQPVTGRLSLRGYGGFVGWGNRTRRLFLKQLLISGASIAAGSALAATLDLW